MSIFISLIELSSFRKELIGRSNVYSTVANLSRFSSAISFSSAEGGRAEKAVVGLLSSPDCLGVRPLMGRWLVREVRERNLEADSLEANIVPRSSGKAGALDVAVGGREDLVGERNVLEPLERRRVLLFLRLSSMLVSSTRQFWFSKIDGAFFEPDNGRAVRNMSFGL